MDAIVLGDVSWGVGRWVWVRRPMGLQDSQEQ